MPLAARVKGAIYRLGDATVAKVWGRRREADLVRMHAPAIADTLTNRFAAGLGYPAEVLLIYRAAYAVVTSNVFTSDGSDGHFPWCVAQLTRAEVTAALDR